jgi:hypothetical protein
MREDMAGETLISLVYIIFPVFYTTKTPHEDRIRVKVH